MVTTVPDPKRRKTIEVNVDDLEFILREWEEFLGEYDMFSRRRFSVAAGVERLRGILGKKSDPDKTPVRPTFVSRSETLPGGIKVPPYHPTKRDGNTNQNGNGENG